MRQERHFAAKAWRRQGKGRRKVFTAQSAMPVSPFSPGSPSGGSGGGIPGDTAWPTDERAVGRKVAPHGVPRPLVAIAAGLIRVP